MAKGQHLSAYQQKIVNRYYANIDTISLQKLTESVSELYLCTDPKKADKLWASVENALAKFPEVKKKAAAVLASRDIKKFAELVNSLAKP